MAARHAALAAQPDPVGMDESDPTGPSGHDYGVRMSSRLTSTFRRQTKIAMDVTPEQVIECMNAANIKNWILMGLHGYVGYLPMPRATQDVDVMVPYDQRAAEQVISQRWPELAITRHSQVTRFADEKDLDHEGKPKPVINLMLPWSPFLETILRAHVVEDKQLASRYPTVEAAIASKYAALISPFRKLAKKEYDAGDLRRNIRNNIESIDRDAIRSLGDQVWDGGGAEILDIIEIVLQDRPFPI